MKSSGLSNLDLFHQVRYFARHGLLWVLLMIVSGAAPASAAAGDVDTTFNPGTGATSRGAVFALAAQPDGKLIVGGNFSGVDGTPRGGVVRLNADGSLDTSFLNSATGANGSVHAIVLQPDGKIVIGGSFTIFNDVPRGGIVRLNADGSLDTTFLGPGQGTDGSVMAMALQPDGKVLIGGFFTTVNGVPRGRVARLNADGSLDTAFLGSVPGEDSFVAAMALQPDGKVVIAGFFTLTDGTVRRSVARLNIDGSLDGSFLSSGSGVDEFGALRSVALQDDGKIVIGGNFSDYNGTQRRNVARLNADGSLDASFLNSLTGASSTVWNVTPQPDGKIIIGGDFTSVNGTTRNRLARLNSDGSLDTSFIGSGSGADARVWTSVILSDGKLLIGGSFFSVNGTPRGGIARLDGSGNLDAAFIRDGGFTNAAVSTLAVQPDGKILIGGGFSHFNGTPRGGIARLNADGSLDASFLSSGSGTNLGLEAVTLQPDGKILIGGPFNDFNGVTGRKIARLNADGSLDTSFVSSIQSGTTVRTIAVQADGKILVGGIFTLVGNQQRFNIARLNADGFLDSSFSTNFFGSTSVEGIIIQPDGKILVAGNRIVVSSGQNVLRLNPDGSLDTSFNATVNGGGFTVQAMALQPDGKVVIGGDFLMVNGTPRNRIARLNPDGSLDTAFLNNGSGVDKTVEAVALQSDGKVLIGGSFFTKVNGVPRNNVARLKADGSLDETFLNFTSGASRSVEAVSIQPDGKVLIGGSFSSVNGVSRFGISRLIVDLAPNPIDTTANFVTQHYRDFLNREPDAAGLAFWINEIESCGADAQCREIKRINVSAAFFLSIEFQETGYLVYRAHQASFNTGPTLRRNDFLTDTQTIGAGVVVGVGNWRQQLEQNKQVYFDAFVNRQTFLDRYPTTMTAAQFVDALNANTLDPLNPSSGGSLSPTERDALVDGLMGGTMSRAQVFRAIAEDSDFNRREFNRAFVLMQYFGYLKRNPNDASDTNFDGYNFWLSKLNQFNGNFIEAEMVKAFISAIEYRNRFG